VIRRNHIEGLFDGVHLCPWRKDTARTNEIDFHDNRVLDVADDFTETDGFSRNVRIFDNYMRKSLSGISVAQALDGPTFILYNVIADCGMARAGIMDGYEGYPFKTNGGSGADIGSGPMFFYHNTSYTRDDRSPAILIKRAKWRKITFRNNIWCGSKVGFESWRRDFSPIDFDYDNLHVASDTGVLFKLQYRQLIPTLEEVFSHFARDEVILNLEIKSPGIEVEVVEMVHRFSRGDRVLICSFQPIVLRKVKETDGEIKIGLLVGRARPITSLVWIKGVSPLSTFRKLRADTLHQHVQLAHPYLIGRCKREGIPIYVWVVDEEAEMRRFIRRGIDGISTNRPDLLSKVIQEESGEAHGRGKAGWGVETNLEGVSSGESIVIPLTGTALKAPKNSMDLGMG